MKDEKVPLTKLANSLYRCTQAYANEVLAKYRLSSGTYPLLLVLYKKEGINQSQVSRELSIDKAMSARAIKSLIKLGYLKKEDDTEDSRAHKLFLTHKAREIIPDILSSLDKWNIAISEGLSNEEKEQMVNSLSKVLKNAKTYYQKLQGNGK